MVKSETTFRRELKAVREAWKRDDLTGLERNQLAVVRATLQWALGQTNVRPNESRRPVAWIMDRSGSAVE